MRERMSNRVTPGQPCCSSKRVNHSPYSAVKSACFICKLFIIKHLQAYYFLLNKVILFLMIG